MASARILEAIIAVTDKCRRAMGKDLGKLRVENTGMMSAFP
jgi:hypothetical protein